MHPIVREFISTDKWGKTILIEHGDKEQFLEMVFLKLFDYFEEDFLGEPIFLEMDQAIISGHPDTGVYLFFISLAINATCRTGNLERAKVLREISNSISKEKLPIELQVFLLQALAHLSQSERNIDKSLKLMNESLALIDKKCKRHTKFFLTSAYLHATEGQLLALIKDEFENLEYDRNDELINLTIMDIKLDNMILTGRCHEGFELFKDYGKNTFQTRVSIQSQESLLKILSGDFNEKSYQIDFYRLFANSCSALIKGNYEKAIEFSKLMKIEINKPGKRFLTLGFSRYFLLHCELSLRNVGKSNLLYQEIGLGSHYLDDLFLGRIQLLESKMVEANESFSRLVNNVKRYGAVGRLLFELQFAKELNTSDILRIMSALNDYGILKNSKVEKKEMILMEKKEKGLNLLIGNSPEINQVKELVKKFAKLKESVLITGETGTGKELVSRAIHDEGAYPKEPFLPINCGALTESLLQSELFGYEAGAFTGAQKERKGIFESAGKGTVFLDEFGDISPKLQVSLLRVLESNEIRLIGGTKTRQIECKIVIATNIDLQQAVKEKKFREDLYFRLARFDIKLPSLRERQEDIPALIDYFLNNQSGTNGKHKVISKDLMGALMEYHWPGNIRELKNEMERLKILSSDKEVINIEDFDFKRLQGAIPFIAKPENKTIEIKLPLSKSNKKELILDHDQILKIVQRGSKTEMRLNAYKELFQVYKKLTRSQLIEITSVSPGTATKDLQSLCEAGFIVKQTPTKSSNSHYFILSE